MLKIKAVTQTKKNIKWKKVQYIIFLFYEPGEYILHLYKCEFKDFWSFNSKNCNFLTNKFLSSKTMKIFMHLLMFISVQMHSFAQTYIYYFKIWGDDAREWEITRCLK